MKLYLVQHGLATPKTENPERPLTEQGVRETERIARFLCARQIPEPIKIIHSGKLRALQTAEIIARELTSDGSLETGELLSPNDDFIPWQQRIAGESNDLMLVGHLPNLAWLANALMTGYADMNCVRLVNSGVVCLERQTPRHFTLLWSLDPSLLE
jgi:phosphohistidine phosphatase